MTCFLRARQTTKYELLGTDTEEEAEAKNVGNFKIQRIGGVVLALVSGVIYSITSAIVKKVSVSSVQTATFRVLGVAIFSLPMAIRSQRQFYSGKNYLLFVLRGLLDAFNIVFRYEALKRLPLTDANVIVFSSSVLTAVFARVFLKEKINIRLVISLILNVAGLILVVKLPWVESSVDLSDQYHITGVIYGLVSTVLTAGTFVLLRKFSQDGHWSIVVFHSGWTTFLFCCGISTFQSGAFSMPNTVKFEQWWLIAIGLLAMAGQVVLCKALKHVTAGPASVLRTGADILATFLWQITFFEEKVDAIGVTGALLVIIGGSILEIRKCKS